jgi:predicted transglutaminase-like cysteine proteinase
MWRVGNSSTWRAVLLAWGLTLTCAPADLMAAQLTPPGSADPAGRSDQPFGLSTTTVAMGPLLDKWLGVEREVDDERRVLKICEDNRASCQSRAALQFLSIVESGRSLNGRGRLGEINRAINLKIKAMSDWALYGAEDVWSPPLTTFANGAGDCEDYAIAKFVALQEAGVSPDDLRIVILHDEIRKEDHAVVAARLDGTWLMLDNLHMAMIDDHHMPNYRPEFVIDHDRVKRYSEAQSASEGPRGYERPVSQILR